MSATWMHSIRGKLTAITMLTSAAAMLLACALFVVQDVVDERAELDMQLQSFGRLIAKQSEAALTFGDQKAAEEALSALRANPSFLAARIYTDRGVPFATYGTGTGVAAPAAPRITDGIVRRDDLVEIFLPIIRDGERIGTVCIASGLNDQRDRLKLDIRSMALILLVCLVAAFILSSRLQRGISGPVVELARVADLVSRNKSFSVRAVHAAGHGDDEIDNLMTGFNSMLAELEQRDQKLVAYKTQLEMTVAQRTTQLTLANKELLVAKNAAENVAAINAQLARQSALILNSATDGIFGVDVDGEPSFLNPAGARMLGRALADLQGTSIHNLIHHSDDSGAPLPGDDCPLGLALHRGEAYSIANDTFWRSDGTSFPTEYSATPMVDEEGNKAGAVLIFRDITERRAIETLKSEFVSTVSHELRTPLTSIRGALGLLSSGLLGPVAEKGPRMLEIAVANTDRLVRLINDILDLERVESGKVELTRGALDAQAVVQQAREGLQSIADQQGIRIVVEPFAGTLWGDSDRVIQTLTNLIGNAIKFSPPDTTVTLSGTAGATEFTFGVADQGRGVPEEKLASIFQRFSQVDASDSRTKGGSGLGLAICQSIVTAHGGRIWAEKNEPAGSRFQFTIPLAVPSPLETATIETSASATIDGEESTAQSVLVVEDDVDLARVMTAAIESHGIRTFHATTGAAAIQLSRLHAPSLIVLDLCLPDLDGFAVVNALRECVTLDHVPLLVYSALDVGSADRSRLRLGPTEFLTKSRGSMADFEGCVVSLLATVTAGKEDEQHAA